MPGKQDTHAAHGEPLGEEAIKGAKRFYRWPDENAKFLVPDGVYDHFKQGIGQRGKQRRDEWFERFKAYRAHYPDLADHIDRIQKRHLPTGWDKDLPVFPADPKGLASRDASGKVLNILAKNIPWLIGGSADLAPSTKTRLTFEGAGDFEANSYAGRNFHFGIREHAMGAILNGMSLVKVRPYGSGFLIFSDYGKAPLRLAAIMEIPVIYVFTHDSIGVGEDGPTHQPVEQLASLRAIPHVVTIRPCDANEVVEAWKVIAADAPRAGGPDPVPPGPPHPGPQQIRLGLRSGAVAPTSWPTPRMADPTCYYWAPAVRFLCACRPTSSSRRRGSKLEWSACHAGRSSRISRSNIETACCHAGWSARVAVEQASNFGWHQYVGQTGAIIAMRTFGASAPLKELLRKFGFTVEAVVKAAREQLACLPANTRLGKA